MQQESERSTLEERVYSAESRFGIGRNLGQFFREFPVAHSLGFRFAERSIKARYRQSFLGILWAFLPPISTAVIWIILYSYNVVNLRDVGVPYPVFVITGTMLWSVFVTSVLTPVQIYQANRGILVKINFPREALLVNAFYEILFNAGVAFIIIILELIIFRVPVGFESLLFLPLLIVLLVLGLGVGLLILPFCVLVKDIQFVLPPILQFAMYLSPVVYAKPIYSGTLKILSYNPVTPVLTSARGCLLGTAEIAPVWQIMAVAGVAFVLLVMGVLLQRLTTGILIERMGS